MSMVHVAAASLAVAAGTYGLLGRAGSRAHRYGGRLYVGSMVVVVVYTAFRLYYLFGRFGIVHWSAVGGGLALLVGTGAVTARRVLPAWRQWHNLGMGASVTGFYAALLVESTYRLFPPAWFWWSTLGPAGAVLLAGGWLLWRHWPGQERPGREASAMSRKLSSNAYLPSAPSLVALASALPRHRVRAGSSR